METSTKRLLVVAHAPSPNTRRLTDAVLRGATHPELEGITVHHVPPLEAVVDDVLAADALILGTPANFGYMSGALKDFFDRVYYPCLDKTRRLPYAFFIRGKTDAEGARLSIERIVTGLGWRAVQPPLLVVGDMGPADVAAAEELGMTVAAGLEAGLY